MTKNKFLSKRLACLLTTALIASPIFLINNKSANAAAVTIADGITVTQADNDGAGANTTAFTAADTVTVGGATAVFNSTAATITIATLTNAVTNSTTFTGGTTIVSGDVTALTGTALTLITGTGSVTLGGNVTNAGTGTSAITLVTTRTLTKSGDDKTVAATISGAGTLAVTGNTTFNGAIGAVALEGLTVAAGKTATFNSTVATGAATVTGTAVLGAATTATALTIATTGTVTNTAKLTGSITMVGDATANINFGSATVGDTNTNPTITTASGSTIVVGKAVTNGMFVFNTANQIDTIDAGSKLFVPANLVNGQTLTIFDDSTAGAVAALATTVTTISQNNALSTYTAAAATEAVVLTSTDKSASTTASELGVNTNKAAGLLQARNAAAAANTAATDTAAIDAIFNVLNARSGQSATADTNFANQVAPQTDTIAGSSVAAKAVTSGVQNIMSTRLASLRSGDAFSTGVVTGSGMSANSGFIQAFGSQVEQKNKGNEFGYDADTTGFALGIDGKVSDGVVVGISYANSKTDVDGKGTGKAKNDIKTNSGSIYADYTTKDGYVEGSITYGQSDNKGSRILNTGGLDRTYKSDYDSEQYSFRLAGGVPINLGAGAFFTPFAGATISQIKTDAYTETSNTANDSLRLRVAQDTVDSQVGTVGVKFHQAIKDGKTTFTPEVKLAVNQEFGDDTITSTNTYQGGGASFKNSTAIEKTSATAGVGLNISSDNVSFNIGYEADVRDKYLGHSAQAKITAKF
jgi:outer membrane autotransporter protein